MDGTEFQNRIHPQNSVRNMFQNRTDSLTGQRQRQDRTGHRLINSYLLTYLLTRLPSGQPQDFRTGQD